MTAAPAPRPAPTHGWRVIVPFVLVSLIWGSTWLVIRDQIGRVPPSWSVVWRFLIAGVALMTYAAARRERLWPGGAGLWLALLIGFTQFALNFQLVYRAEQHVTSGIVAVLFALLIVPNTLLAKLVLGAPLNRRFLIGSVIALGGIALLLLHEVRLAPPGAQAGRGIALAAAGMLSASAANVLQARPAARRFALAPLLAWAMLLASVLNLAFAWAMIGPPRFEWSARYAGGVAYLALIGTVITFPLYYRLIREIGAGPAAYTNVLIPVVAMTLSTLFEGYRWSLLAGGGVALALIGLAIALRARIAASPSR